MRIIDKKFKTNEFHYVLQSILATIVICIILLLLDVKTDAAVIAALGASTFIAFTMPHAAIATSKKLIGGYLVGIFSAGLMCAICKLPYFQNNVFWQNYSFIVFGSLAVGLAMFLMGITNTEHPPAASLALGLVFDSFSLHTVYIVFIAIIFLFLVKASLKRFLKDLM